jgi:signal transduction histidine kinase
MVSPTHLLDADGFAVHGVPARSGTIMPDEARCSLVCGDLGVRLRQSIEESWLRSRTYGIDRDHVREQAPDHVALVPAQQRSRQLLEAADPVVTMVHSVLRSEPHMVALSDPDGVIVRFLASQHDGGAKNLFEGASWAERDIGTNGIGTALAARVPVLIFGPQHFVRDYSHWTCIGVPVRSADGRLLGALDLSVRNERMSVHTWGWTLSLAGAIEAELARASRPRVAELDEVVRRLHDDRQRLEEWDRRKDGAFATLSHELNNPLHAMVMSLELLDRTYGDPRRFREVSGRLRRDVRRLARVVDDIGDVARVKRGGLVVHMERHDLNGVLRHAADAVRAQMDRLGHAVRMSLAPEPLLIDGDPVRLEQVFTNILGNAAKYTPPGGHVVVESGAARGEARVRVRDDGHGIEPRDLDRIFGEFTRVVRPVHDPGGLGIGLALVRSLVRLHGGSVIARSDGPGKGSEFEVALPLAGRSRAA